MMPLAVESVAFVFRTSCQETKYQPIVNILFSVEAIRANHVIRPFLIKIPIS
jgi:hypothetical protein